MKTLLGVLLILIFATPVFAGGYLYRDASGTVLQAFVASPALSSNQVITAGQSYILDTTDWLGVRFYADGELQVKLGSNTASFRSYEGILLIKDLAQVVFYNAGATTVNLDLEGMK